MLEYSKEILLKVSFDQGLFRKELKKATKWLKKDEKRMFMLWCFTTFGARYYDVLAEVFKKVS